MIRTIHSITGGALRSLAARSWLWSILVVIGWPAYADDFCAVTVRLVDANGRDLLMSSTWIELEAPNGKTVLRKPVTTPNFQLCDFGFGPHTLKIGVNECLPVAVSNLRVVLGEPVFLNVILNPCSYRAMRSGCLVYFRVSEPGGRALRGVDIAWDTRSNSRVTDEYGRWQGLLQAGQSTATFIRPEYERATARISCRSDEEIDQEVVMEPLASH